MTEQESPKIRIVEVGPRDGLQSLNAHYSVETRLEWIGKLAHAGIQEIECGAFVRADLVPAMANSDQIFQSLAGSSFRKWALVPNRRGLQSALDSGADALAFFTSATEGFSQKNTACNREDSIDRFHAMVPESGDLPLRAYLSCCFECPYDGPVDPEEVLRMAVQLQKAGATEIVISDTIGSARPEQISPLFRLLGELLPLSMLALHLHDTHGRALECAREAWDHGITSFDASAGGLGGCPFAPGATGNVATEALVQLFEDMGISTGIDVDQLKATRSWFTSQSPIQS